VGFFVAILKRGASIGLFLYICSRIVFIKKQDLEWQSGKEHVILYKPALPYKYGRCFCKQCGTSLGEILSDDESFPIGANALDGEFAVRNQFHEFVSEKPS